MGGRKPEWLDENVSALTKLCKEKGYEIAKLDHYHYRVLGAVSIVDIWPSRMKYNVLSVEGSFHRPDYRSDMDQVFNKKQVVSLLERGKL